MAVVRRGLAILLLATGLAGCGGGESGPDFAGARDRTTDEETAAFTLLIDASVGGNTVRATESGAISFTEPRAHLYKLVPGGGLPQEMILDGPYVYTNANVEAATSATAPCVPGRNSTLGASPRSNGADTGQARSRSGARPPRRGGRRRGPIRRGGMAPASAPRGSARRVGFAPRCRAGTGCTAERHDVGAPKRLSGKTVQR